MPMSKWSVMSNCSKTYIVIFILFGEMTLNQRQRELQTSFHFFFFKVWLCSSGLELTILLALSPKCWANSLSHHSQLTTNPDLSCVRLGFPGLSPSTLARLSVPLFCSCLGSNVGETHGCSFDITRRHNLTVNSYSLFCPLFHNVP